MKNIFVYGMSGAGKDTVSDYFHKNYFYIKLRIADTIKRIVCETQNLTFEELEIQKRENPMLRTLHNQVSKILDDLAGMEQSSLLRLGQLINGTALDFQQIENHKNIPKVVCDCRTKKEAEMLLKAGWVGIFLARRSDEFKDTKHFTESDLFLNGTINELQKVYKKQMYTIYNGVNIRNDAENRYIPYYETNGDVKLLYTIMEIIVEDFVTGTTPDQLSMRFK